MKNLSDLLSALVNSIGQGTLADKIGIDPSALCRFRSGQGTLSLKVIENILDAGEIVLVQRAEMEKRENALEVISDLWKEERRKKT